MREHEFSRTSYVSTLPEEFQRKIRQAITKALTDNGNYNEDDVDRAMSSRLCDLDDLIDTSMYLKITEPLSAFSE